MKHPFSVACDFDLGAKNIEMTTEAVADVIVREGQVSLIEDPTFEGAAFQIRPGNFVINVPDGTRICARDGCEIIYSRGPRTGDRDLALFILGSVWGALCYQRGLVPIHASALIAEHGLVAFTGKSGAGKSTLTANLSRRGFDFFTDDTLIFDPASNGDEPMCYAGQKQLKLWGDAIEATGARALQPIREAGEIDKHFAIPPNTSEHTVAPLRKLIVLDSARGKIESANSLVRLTGSEALVAIKSNLYRPHYSEPLMGRKALFLAFKKLAETIEVHRFTRLRGPENYEPALDFIATAIGPEEAR